MPSLAANAPNRAVSERAIVFLIGAVQFVNILDFMMVMPLGPDFSTELGIPLSHIGYVGGAYTAAAAVAGLVGAGVLERFDRRKALAFTMLGLVIGTALGALAVDLWTLLLARVVAGFFGGPATSLALAIIADVVPPERRGKALGAVMGAFAAASVLGVPAGLELARVGGWRLPFLAVAGLGSVIAALGIFLLPPLRVHLDARAKAGSDAPLSVLLGRPETLLGLITTALVMGGMFCLIPSISPYVQHNLGYPRDGLGMLYLMGGVVSFFANRVVGRLVDRHGPTVVGTAGCALLAFFIFAGYYETPPWVSVPVMFVGFFLAMAFRNVPYHTLMTLVPGPTERSRYLSLQSATQHVASAAGAFLASMMLTERADHALQGMDRVALVALGATVVLPVLFLALERRVRRVAVPG